MTETSEVQIDRQDLLGIGSIVTYRADGQIHPIGYLIPFQGAYYDAKVGPLQLTDEEAARHDAALSSAQIARLDRCEPGHAEMFYLGRSSLTTRTGEQIDGDLTVDDATVTLNRNGRTFTGSRSRNGRRVYLVCTA